MVDINADGIKDLVVGEPYAGAETLMYNGGVQVFFGHLDDHFSLEKGFSIKCVESPCGLGSTISVSEFAAEFGEDGGGPVVVITAPNAGIGGRQRGGFITLRQQSGWKTGKEYLVPGDPINDNLDWDYGGDQDFEQIGTIVASAGFVAIGSPTFRVSALGDGGYSEEDVQAAGHVTVLMDGADLEIVGTAEFGSLGSSLAVVNMTMEGEYKSLLAVGESSADSESGGYLQTGRVRLYQVDTMAGTVEEVATISGSSELGRFGMRLHPGWAGGMLVGAPYTGLGLHNYGKVQ